MYVKVKWMKQLSPLFDETVVMLKVPQDTQCSKNQMRLNSVTVNLQSRCKIHASICYASLLKMHTVEAGRSIQI